MSEIQGVGVSGLPGVPPTVGGKFQEGALEEGRCTATKRIGSKSKKYRTRSTSSASSQDGLRSGSDSGEPRAESQKKGPTIMSNLYTRRDTLSLAGSSSNSDDDEEEVVSPRKKTQINSSGCSHFCVRRIEQHSYGRREIEIAEQEMPGIMALRKKARVRL